jgi:hypothetical protein
VTAKCIVKPASHASTKHIIRALFAFLAPAHKYFSASFRKREEQLRAFSALRTLLELPRNIIPRRLFAISVGARKPLKMQSAFLYEVEVARSEKHKYH